MEQRITLEALIFADIKNCGTMYFLRLGAQKSLVLRN